MAIENVGGYRHKTVALGKPFLFLLKLALYGVIAISVFDVVHQGSQVECLSAIAGLSVLYLSWFVCAKIKNGSLASTDFIRHTLNTSPLVMTMLYAGVISSIAAAAVLAETKQSMAMIVWMAGDLMLLASVCEAAVAREKISIAEKANKTS